MHFEFRLEIRLHKKGSNPILAHFLIQIELFQNFSITVNGRFIVIPSIFYNFTINSTIIILIWLFFITLMDFDGGNGSF